MNKFLVTSVILLFLGSSIPVLAHFNENNLPSSRGNWLYVGGSGPGNYSTIQAAINAASEGNIIFVFDDSSPYIERITVNKKLFLIGESRTSTRIESPGYPATEPMVRINSNNVSMSGFFIQLGINGIIVNGENTILTNLQIQGGPDPGGNAIHLSKANHTYISQIIVNGTMDGINTGYGGSSSNTTVEHSIFSNCSWCAICSVSPDYVIRENIISHCKYGIVSSSRGIIQNNTILSCSDGGITVNDKDNLFLDNIKLSIIIF